MTRQSSNNFMAFNNSKMTTILFTGLLLVGSNLGAKGQTWSEWWNQKKTRMKYMREQEAALAALQQTTANGYAGTLLEMWLVDSFFMKDYSQHWNFFNELRRSNPALIDAETMEEYVAKEDMLISRIQMAWELYSRHPGGIGPSIMSYFDLFDEKIEKIGLYKEELLYVTRTGEFTMLDSERWKELYRDIESIHAIYDELFDLVDCLDEMFVADDRREQDIKFLQTLRQ